MHRFLEPVAGIALIVGIFFGLWHLNLLLGRRTGEIDHGNWYLMQGRTGISYFIKGIDPGNRYLDHDDAQDLIADTPSYRKTVTGYGAIWIDRGFVGDATIRTSTWQLFDTEEEALTFLADSGVDKQDIHFLHE